MEMRITETSSADETVDGHGASPFQYSDQQRIIRADTATSTADNFVEQTLGTYLINNRQYTRILSLCGGLHIPFKLNYNDISMNILNIWRLILVFATTIYLISVSMDFAYNVEDVEYRSTLLFLWPLAMAFQSIIIYPLLYIVSTRMKDKITFETTLCITDTLLVCWQYLMCAAALYFVLVVVFTYYLARLVHTGEGPDSWKNSIKIGLQYGSITFVGVLCVSLLSVWAVFFMVLDAKVTQMELRKLKERVEQQNLNMREYISTYDKQVTANYYSHRMGDGVALVSYFGLCSLVAVLVSYRAKMGTKVDLLVVGFCCLTREALLLLMILPQVAKSNDLMKSLQLALVEGEWNDTIIHNDPSRQSSTNSLVFDYNNTPNMVCLRLWAYTTTKPVHISILGMVFQGLDMRAQSVGFAVLLLGTFAGFFIDKLYNAGNEG